MDERHEANRGDEAAVVTDANAGSSRYEQVTADLRTAYDAAVGVRVGREASIEPWKAEERERFLTLLVQVRRTNLLEIGAGTGTHGAYFAEHQIEVVCTDLSPAMVEQCRSRGLEAHEQDFLHLDLGRTFDACFACNCLLHVPREDLPTALGRVRVALVPGAPFYLGQYGGIVRDGPWGDDDYEPKRYFSWLLDDELRAIVSEQFTVESFRAIDTNGPDGAHFQSLILRT